MENSHNRPQINRFADCDVPLLALLATFAAPHVVRYLGKAKSETAKLQINAIASAVELYALDNGDHPRQQVGLAALLERPLPQEGGRAYRSVGAPLSVPESGT